MRAVGQRPRTSARGGEGDAAAGVEHSQLRMHAPYTCVPAVGTSELRTVRALTQCYRSATLCWHGGGGGGGDMSRSLDAHLVEPHAVCQQLMPRYPVNRSRHQGSAGVLSCCETRARVCSVALPLRNTRDVTASLRAPITPPRAHANA